MGKIRDEEIFPSLQLRMECQKPKTQNIRQKAGVPRRSDRQLLIFGEVLLPKMTNGRGFIFLKEKVKERKNFFKNVRESSKNHMAMGSRSFLFRKREIFAFSTYFLFPGILRIADSDSFSLLEGQA